MIFKRTFKVLTETNKVFFIQAFNRQEVRFRMYQKVGSELFTIKAL